MANRLFFWLQRELTSSHFSASPLRRLLRRGLLWFKVYLEFSMSTRPRCSGAKLYLENKKWSGWWSSEREKTTKMDDGQRISSRRSTSEVAFRRPALQTKLKIFKSVLLNGYRMTLNEAAPFWNKPAMDLRGIRRTLKDAVQWSIVIGDNFSEIGLQTPARCFMLLG